MPVEMAKNAPQLFMQELPFDQRMARGLDRGGRPSEPGGQPQASGLFSPLQGDYAMSA